MLSFLSTFFIFYILFCIFSVLICAFYHVIVELYSAITYKEYSLSGLDLYFWITLFPYKLWVLIDDRMLLKHISFSDKKEAIDHLEKIMSCYSEVEIYKQLYVYNHTKDCLYIYTNFGNLKKISFNKFLILYIKSKIKNKSINSFKTYVELNKKEIENEQKIRELSKKDIENILKHLERN